MRQLSAQGHALGSAVRAAKGHWGPHPVGPEATGLGPRTPRCQGKQQHQEKEEVAFVSASCSVMCVRDDTRSTSRANAVCLVLVAQLAQVLCPPVGTSCSPFPRPHFPKLFQGQ